MESEPVFKKFKHDVDLNNICDDLLKEDATANEFEVAENNKLDLAHTIKMKLTDTEIIETSQHSVILKEDELKNKSLQKKTCNLNNLEEEEPEITSKIHVKESLLPNEVLSSKDKELTLDQVMTSSQKKSTDVSLSGKAASINSNVKGKKSKRKRKKKCEKHVSPNYFVAVQVSNPEIHKAVLNVQKTMLSSNKRLSESFIDIATLHITLFVIHIPTDDQLHVACSALDHCGAELTKSLSEDPLCLKFSGISHFANKTIFAQLVEDNDYKKFLAVADVIKEKFIEMGIVLPDERSLSPHLTIAKLSKMYKDSGKYGIRKIEPKVYASEVNREFGEQIVTGLQLLAMDKPKDEKRYYYSVREALFDFVPPAIYSDHSECCFPPQTEDPKSSKVYSHTSNKESVSSSSSFTPDSSNTSVCFSPIPLKLKENFCNVNNMKDISSKEIEKKKKSFHERFGKSLADITGTFFGEIYSYLFLEVFSHMLNICFN